jgi:hypothetical protein
MVIEYKIRFSEDGVTVTQTVEPGLGDTGGASGARPDPGGASGARPDPGGAPGARPGPGAPPDRGGSGPGGRLVAVVFGPVIIGNAGGHGPVASAAPKVFGKTGVKAALEAAGVKRAAVVKRKS